METWFVGVLWGVFILAGFVWVFWTKFLKPPPAPDWKEPVPRHDPPPLREISFPRAGDDDDDGD
jgi:hypothetical protein